MSTRSDVTIAPAIRQALVRHARRDRPRECCGLLVGRGEHIAFAVPTKNLDPGLTRFRIDAAVHVELRRVLRAFVPALEIVGAYHSHARGPAWPSTSDVREAYYPEWIHLVVGMRGGRAQVRAFRLRHGRIQPLRITWRAGPRRRH